MRVIFSRKGFDSTAGGAPSPIVEGRPISLPIPADRRSATSYGDLGLGKLAHGATRGRLGAADLCHDDPMFGDGLCWFGQSGSAQGHLARHGVQAGDVFLFFGLFADPETRERHHRIFGYLRVACLGAPRDIRLASGWTDPPRPHPHFAGDWGRNNMIYHGPGRVAAKAADALRLTDPGGPLTTWRVPPWLRRRGLTYHDRAERWLRGNRLDSAKRGQEFVSDIGRAAGPRQWLAEIIAEIES